MATVIDLLRHLGEHAAPDGDNALAGPVTLPGVTDSPLALPLPPALITAWTRLVGRPTLGHHALALSAAQTQHSVALMGHGSSPHDDLLLLTLSQLQRQPTPALLYIAPHDETTFRSRLVALAETLGIRWLDAAQPGGRITQAQLILATPSDLHRRVLRYHDRAWRWLWPQLRFVALPALHGYTGAEAGHLHWLLRRVERLTAHTPLQLLVSLASVADVGATLGRLLDRPMQVVAAPDGPSHSTLIALWRCGSDRAATVLRLAGQLTARRLAITVVGRDAEETERLRGLAATSGIAQVDDARVAIVAGIPRAIDDRQSLLRSGYRLLILLAGGEPHELLFAAQPDVLLNALPYWPLANSNPYVVAAHLTCAAAERPLEEAEIDRWAVRELRDRLVKKGTLQPLPSGDLWPIAPEIDDPYAEVDPRAIGGPPLVVFDPQGKPIATVPPALQDRCTLPDQVFVPGLRIVRRDESRQTIQLAPDLAERATVVLTETSVHVREELAARTIRFGKQTADLIKGKVLATQQIAGLRELRPDAPERRLPTNAPETQWLASACWIPVSGPVADPQAMGWAITQALPLVALASPAALAPAYAAEQQRLYLIETEPGGVGIADCVYSQFERLIELALELARACAARPVYKRLATAEMAWISRLYDPAASIEVEQPQPVAVPAKTPLPVPAIAQPAKAPLPAQAIPQPSARPPGPVEKPAPQLQPKPTPAEPPKPQPQTSARPPGPVEKPAPQLQPKPTPAEPPKPQPKPTPAVPAEPPRQPAPKPQVADRAPRSTPPTPAPASPVRPAAQPRADHSAADRERPALAPVPQRPQVADQAARTDRPIEARPPVQQSAPQPETTRPAPAKPVAGEQPLPTARLAAVYTAPEKPAPPAATPIAAASLEQSVPQPEIAAEPEPAPSADTTKPAPPTPAVAQPTPQPEVVEAAPAMAAAAPQPEGVEHAAPPAPPAEPLAAAPAPTPQPRPATRYYRIEDLLPPLEDEDEGEAAPTEREQPIQPGHEEQPVAATRNGRPKPLDDRAAARTEPPPQRTAPPVASPARTNPPHTTNDAARSPTDERPRSEPSAPRPRSEPPSRPPQPSRQRSEPQRPFSHRSPVRQHAPNTPTPKPDQQRPSPPPYQRRGPQQPQPTSDPARRQPPASERRDRDDRPARSRPSNAPRPQERARQPFNHAQPPDPQPEPEADVHAMIERMRRLRQEREAAQRQPAPRVEQSAPDEPAELRFHIGERVQCLPYGIGTVRSSSISGGREQVIIEFPEHGEIEVDPALNLIRKLGPGSKADQQDVDEMGEA